MLSLFQGFQKYEEEFDPHSMVLYRVTPFVTIGFNYICFNKLRLHLASFFSFKPKIHFSFVTLRAWKVTKELLAL